MSKIAYVEQSGIARGIDFDAHYSVKGWKGIAFFLLGWSAEDSPVMGYATDEDGNEVEVETGEFETVPCFDCVVAVMVGDDRRHVVDVADLAVLEEDKFCRSCGQIGCGCNVYA